MNPKSDINFSEGGFRSDLYSDVPEDLRYPVASRYGRYDEFKNFESRLYGEEEDASVTNGEFGLKTPEQLNSECDLWKNAFTFLRVAGTAIIPSSVSRCHDDIRADIRGDYEEIIAEHHDEPKLESMTSADNLINAIAYHSQVGQQFWDSDGDAENDVSTEEDSEAFDYGKTFRIDSGTPRRGEDLIDDNDEVKGDVTGATSVLTLSFEDSISDLVACKKKDPPADAFVRPARMVVQERGRFRNRTCDVAAGDIREIGRHSFCGASVVSHHSVENNCYQTLPDTDEEEQLTTDYKITNIIKTQQPNKNSTAMPFRLQKHSLPLQDLELESRNINRRNNLMLQNNVTTSHKNSASGNVLGSHIMTSHRHDNLSHRRTNAESCDNVTSHGCPNQQIISHCNIKPQSDHHRVYDNNNHGNMISRNNITPLKNTPSHTSSSRYSIISQGNLYNNVHKELHNNITTHNNVAANRSNNRPSTRWLQNKSFPLVSSTTRPSSFSMKTHHLNELVSSLPHNNSIKLTAVPFRTSTRPPSRLTQSPSTPNRLSSLISHRPSNARKLSLPENYVTRCGRLSSRSRCLTPLVDSLRAKSMQFGEIGAGRRTSVPLPRSSISGHNKHYESNIATNNASMTGWNLNRFNRIPPIRDMSNRGGSTKKVK